MEYSTLSPIHSLDQRTTENRMKTASYKYKVHSAIYSWGEPESKVRATHDVTKVAQDILSESTNNGILTINNSYFIDPAPGCRKSFAIIVSIVCEDGNEVTRFCSCLDGTTLNVKDTGVICYF